MAAEAATIPLLTPYKLGKFNLSRRYTNTPCKVLFLFCMIWIVNMCDGFWFFFFFFLVGLFWMKLCFWFFFFFFFFHFDFVKKKGCLWHIPVVIMNCFIYKGFNFQEIVVYDNICRLHNTLALLSIFLLCLTKKWHFFPRILNINLLQVWDFC